MKSSTRFYSFVYLFLALLIGLPILWLVWPSFERHVLGKPEILVLDKGELRIGETTGSQSFANHRERHVYRFKGKAGKQVRIRVDNSLDTLSSVRVFAENDQHEIRNIGANHNESVIVEFTLPEAPDVYVFVDSTAPGDYQLWLECDSEGGCD